MAEPSESTSQRESHQTPTTASTETLRALAQTHLSEIEAEDSALAHSTATKKAEMQKYVKVRRRDRPRPSPSPSPSLSSPAVAAAAAAETSSKGPRLRTAQDVLNRLRHDPSLRLEEYVIGYVERFDGLREMAAHRWIGESTDEDWIPLHRIRYVKRAVDGETEVVWDRDAFVDKIFGSGLTGTEIGDGDGDELETVASEAGGVLLH